MAAEDQLDTGGYLTQIGRRLLESQHREERINLVTDAIEEAVRTSESQLQDRN